MRVRTHPQHLRNLQRLESLPLLFDQSKSGLCPRLWRSHWAKQKRLCLQTGKPGKPDPHSKRSHVCAADNEFCRTLFSAILSSLLRRWRSFLESKHWNGLCPRCTHDLVLARRIWLSDFYLQGIRHQEWNNNYIPVGLYVKKWNDCEFVTCRRLIISVDQMQFFFRWCWQNSEASLRQLSSWLSRAKCILFLYVSRNMFCSVSHGSVLCRDRNHF